jgi:hypothetical protein
MKKIYICLCIAQTILLISILYRNKPTNTADKQGINMDKKLIPSLYKLDTTKLTISI